MSTDKIAGLIYATNEETGRYGRRWVEFTMPTDAPWTDVVDRGFELAFGRQTEAYTWMMEDEALDIVGWRIHDRKTGEQMTDGVPLTWDEAKAEVRFWGAKDVEARMVTHDGSVIAKPTAKQTRQWVRENN
jgi:hypothetical protein